MKHAAVMAGLALGLMSGTAKAAYIVDFEQVGGNVVATGRGSIDFTGLVPDGSARTGPGFSNDPPVVRVGALSTADYYEGPITGPSTIGNGNFASDASSGIGGPFGLFLPENEISVPQGYSSGTSVGISSATFNDVTLASLGLTVGSTFVYSFPTGSKGVDTFTVDVVSAVPLPASAPMFGAAVLALGAVGYGLKRKKAAAAA